MSNPARHARHYLALRLADRWRALDPERQMAAAIEWRAALDEITAAIKLARRSHSERARTAKNDGREIRLYLPGLSGRLFDLVWDYIVEGAAAGAGREITADDAPVLADAYRLTERAVFDSVRAARVRAGGNETHRRQLRRVAIASAPYVAAAIGYSAMRQSSLQIDLIWFVGKETPALEIAVLALSELGHSNAAIARGLEIDSGAVRRYLRAERSALCS